jgi:hypothetical protein
MSNRDSVGINLEASSRATDASIAKVELWLRAIFRSTSVGFGGPSLESGTVTCRQRGEAMIIAIVQRVNTFRT